MRPLMIHLIHSLQKSQLFLPIVDQAIGSLTRSGEYFDIDGKELHRELKLL